MIAAALAGFVGFIIGILVERYTDPKGRQAQSSDDLDVGRGTVWIKGTEFVIVSVQASMNYNGSGWQHSALLQDAESFLRDHRA